MKPNGTPMAAEAIPGTRRGHAMNPNGIRSNVQKPPETLDGARTFDQRRDFYSELGLCNRCAAQAAFGHANGFASVCPACFDCATIVATFPDPAAGGWRKHSAWTRPRQGRVARKPPATAVHPKCGKRFANNNTTGHCSGCCQTFHGAWAFDAHRRGGACIMPDPSAGPWRLDPKGEWHYGNPTAFISRVTGGAR